METIDVPEVSLSLEDRVVLVDFDETLFLRNSTEEYLNSLQPRSLGAILLIALDILKPWNRLPGQLKGEISRDWCRVVIGTLLFPWTLLLWPSRAKKLIKNYTNQRLVKILTEPSNSRIIIATLGFDWIVNPMFKHLPFAPDGVISCRFLQGGFDRRRGKHELAKAALSQEELDNAAVITDSMDDEQLLNIVGAPYFIRWPEAKYVPAMSDAYIPFLYLEKAKRPGEQYFVRNVFGDDWLALVFAVAWISPNPLLQGISLIFLVLSFWCIYEFGYADNDFVAERYEDKPTLSETYQRYLNRMKLWPASLWAVIFAIPGLFVHEFIKFQSDLFNPDLEILKAIGIDAIAWCAFLFVVWLSFWGYNRIDKQTRVWLYFVLQIHKCFGFLVVATTNIAGVMLFAAQVLARWIGYIVYRLGKQAKWMDFPGELFRCFLFAFLMISVALGTGQMSALLSWQTGIIFLWTAYRGRKQFLQIIRQAYPIAKERSVVAK